MKTVNTLSWLVLVIGLLLISRCSPPYKPDHDVGVGKLIFKATCQSQTVYLMDLVYLQAYKSGYAYSDTITVNGVRYTHVVRLDSSQSTFLATKQPNDKLSIHFQRVSRSLLPGCTGLSANPIELVKVVSISNTNY